MEHTYLGILKYLQFRYKLKTGHDKINHNFAPEMVIIICTALDTEDHLLVRANKGKHANKSCLMIASQKAFKL